MSTPSTAHLFEGTPSSCRPLTFRRETDCKRDSMGLRRSELSNGGGLLSRSSSLRRVKREEREEREEGEASLSRSASRRRLYKG